MANDEANRLEIESICVALGDLAERLGDVALDELRTAVSSGAKSRPPLERQVTRARSAIERAIGILSRRHDEEDDDTP